MNLFIFPRWMAILLVVLAVVNPEPVVQAFVPASRSLSLPPRSAGSLEDDRVHRVTIPSSSLLQVSTRRHQKTSNHSKRGRQQEPQDQRSHCTSLSALPWSSCLVSPADSWGNWMVLLGNAFLGERLSKTSAIGRLLGPPITAMTFTFAMATCGILQTGGTIAATQLQTLALYMATPLVLLGTDFYGCTKRCGPLLTSFGLAALATFVASVVGWLVAGPSLSLAMGHSDALKIAAAIFARNVGGGLNYMAVCATLQASPTAIAAGLCADNLFGLIYFPAVSYIATGRMDPELSEAAERQSAITTPTMLTQQHQKQDLAHTQHRSLPERQMDFKSDSKRRRGLRPTGEALVLEASTTTATSAAIVPAPESYKTTIVSGGSAVGRKHKVSDDLAVTTTTTTTVDTTVTLDRMTSVLFSASALVWLGQLLGRGGGASLPLCTLLTVLFVNRLAPRTWVQSIQPTAELLGTVALYVFFSTLGSQGVAVADSVRSSMGPLIVFLSLLYCIHGAWLCILYRLTKQTSHRKLDWLRRSLSVPRVLVASSAAIGGPATAVALCQSNQWLSLKVPALLVGNLGDAFGTFLGIAFYWLFAAVAGSP